MYTHPRRGSALGGHYYAYIKSFENNKWYEFNDSQVSEITEEEVKKTYGEDTSLYRSRPGVMQMFYSSGPFFLHLSDPGSQCLYACVSPN